MATYIFFFYFVVAQPCSLVSFSFLFLFLSFHVLVAHNLIVSSSSSSSSSYNLFLSSFQIVGVDVDCDVGERKEMIVGGRDGMVRLFDVSGEIMEETCVFNTKGLGDEAKDGNWETRVVGIPLVGRSGRGGVGGEGGGVMLMSVGSA